MRQLPTRSSLVPFRLDSGRGAAWFARPARSSDLPALRESALPPTLRRAEVALSHLAPAAEHRRRPLRVPLDAMVTIGSRGLPAPRRPLLLAGPPARSANDNRAPGEPAFRFGWREAFFLAILFATVIGAFQSGRLHAAHKVIVVPGPSSHLSVVT